MSKRENGSGSIFKRSDLKHNQWVARGPAQYDLDDDGNLVEKRAVIGTFRTKAEAREALDQFLITPTDKYNYTLQECYEEWKRIAFGDISKQTRDNYTACWEKICAYPVKNIADEKISNVTTADLRGVLDHYAGQLSHSYITKLKALMTQIYRYAEENNIVKKNYASLVKIPKQVKKSSKARAFTDMEFKKLEDNWRTVPGADAVYALCFLGFRVSEFCQLTQFSYDRHSKTITGGLKTDAGKDRVVPVHKKIQPIIDAWADRGCGALYADKSGKPYNKDSFRVKVWKPVITALGLPDELTPHSCRHTCATKLSAAGARPEDIKRILGHEDYSMTANVYIDQDVETLKKAMEKIV